MLYVQPGSCTQASGESQALPLTAQTDPASLGGSSIATEGSPSPEQSPVLTHLQCCSASRLPCARWLQGAGKQQYQSRQAGTLPTPPSCPAPQCPTCPQLWEHQRLCASLATAVSSLHPLQSPPTVGLLQAARGYDHLHLNGLAPGASGIFQGCQTLVLWIMTPCAHVEPQLDALSCPALQGWPHASGQGSRVLSRQRCPF